MCSDSLLPFFALLIIVSATHLRINDFPFHQPPRHTTLASFCWVLKGAPIDGQRNFSLVWIFSHEIYTLAPWRLTRRAREAMACRTFGRGFFFFFVLLVGRKSRLWELVEDCLRNSYESISQRHGAQRSFYKNNMKLESVLPSSFSHTQFTRSARSWEKWAGKIWEAKIYFIFTGRGEHELKQFWAIVSLSLNGAAIGEMENWHSVWMLSQLDEFEDKDRFYATYVLVCPMSYQQI